MKYYIFGQEVNKETHDKYSGQTFMIGGRERNLKGIEIWANSREVAENLPDEYAEARAVYDKILSEIKASCPAVKTYKGFLEKLNSIYRESAAAYNENNNTFSIAEADYKKTMQDTSAPEYIKVIATGDYERAKMTRKETRDAVKKNYEDRVREIRQEMSEFIDGLFRATPERVDQRAMQLLDTGIMSAAEMQSLAANYRNNPTMLRIIGSRAKAAADSAKDGGAYRVLSKSLEKETDSSRLLEQFDTLADFGNGGLGGGRAQSLGEETAIAKIHEKHWDRYYHTACEHYDAMFVQPGEE